MTHALFSYIPSSKYDQYSIVSEIKELFSKNVEITEREEVNPFTGEKINQLIFEGKYVISISLEDDDEVLDFKKQLGIHSEFDSAMIRVVFGYDEDNRFENIDIIIYDYLTNLDRAVIYSPSQKKVVFSYNDE